MFPRQLDTILMRPESPLGQIRPPAHTPLRQLVQTPLLGARSFLLLLTAPHPPKDVPTPSPLSNQPCFLSLAPTCPILTLSTMPQVTKGSGPHSVPLRKTTGVGWDMRANHRVLLPETCCFALGSPAPASRQNAHLLRTFIHSLTVYTHWLSARHSGHTREPSGGLPSCSQADEPINALTGHGGSQVGKLNTICGSSLFLPCILTAPPLVLL